MGAIWGLKPQKAPENYFKLLKERTAKLNEIKDLGTLLKVTKSIFRGSNPTSSSI